MGSLSFDKSPRNKPQTPVQRPTAPAVKINNFSLFDLFKVGIGPSSSHTVGPMIAANRFVKELEQLAQLHSVKKATVELFGSLAATGVGHGTDIACIVGLEGHLPDTVDPNEVKRIAGGVKASHELALGKFRHIRFNWDEDLIFHNDQTLPEHPNGMTFTAKGENDAILHRRTYFSIGGGFVVAKDESAAIDENFTPPYHFTSGKALLELCKEHEKTIAELVLENELARLKITTPSATMEILEQQIDLIWREMAECMNRGMSNTGKLPGGLSLQRRAKKMHDAIIKRAEEGEQEDSDDWVNLFAMAVSEENAAGGRIVTSPTNGAAGVIPAVIGYYDKFVPDHNKEGIRTFLATAAAIGSLYKYNASISAAEVGCQGEIGVACSMAAAGLCAAKGGTVEQVENAAEIGMEHNLGLTCDPIQGLVQVPCIERNTMGAVKAINAARLALRGDGLHYVSLDSVIKTMYETGKDMNTKYKETSTGGLAQNSIPINHVDC